MTKSLYEIIQEIVKDLKRNSGTYQEMLDRLTQEGMDKEDAEKLLRRLLDQIVDEER